VTLRSRTTRAEVLRGVPALFDRYWPLIALAVFPLVVILNYDGHGMQGIIPNYLCLKDTIVSDFDPTPPGAPECSTPTFPMWGYAWLLLVTESKLALLVLQNLVAITAVWFFVRTLEQHHVLGLAGSRVLKLLVILSLPWYAFNSLRWPYSIAVALVLVAAALLIRGVERKAAVWPFAAAGAAFGLALNFRSDYIVVPVFVALGLVALSRVPLRRRLVWAGAWAGATYLLLVPWAVYTQHVTGDPLLTSTNSGHVLFISLGNLPGNTWGITPVDGDPRMVREVRGEFGHERTLIHESDDFLRRRFFELVAADPAEYARKDLHNLLTVPADGVYPGEFLEEKECQPRCLERYGVEDSQFQPAVVEHVLTADGLGADEYARFSASLVSGIQARAVPLLALFVLPFFLVAAIRRRAFPHMLIGGIFAFQVALNTFAFTLPAYTANAYVPMLVVIAWFVERMLAWRRKRARAREAAVAA
jgi:hypothetical protein